MKNAIITLGFLLIGYHAFGQDELKNDSIPVRFSLIMIDSALHTPYDRMVHFGLDYFSALIRLSDTVLLNRTPCMTVLLHSSFRDYNKKYIGLLEERPIKPRLYNFSTDSLTDDHKPLLFQSLVNEYYIHPLPLNGGSTKEREIEIRIKYEETEVPYYKKDFMIELDFVGSNGEFQHHITESSKSIYRIKVNCYSDIKIKVHSEFHLVSEYELESGCNDESFTIWLSRKIKQ